MTPSELRFLANLRARGQAPELAVFVTDNWAKATELTDDVGVLTIRVRNARDFEHNWSPVAGLWVYLWLRWAKPAELADFSAAILRANPAKLTTKVNDMRSVDVWPLESWRAA